MKIYTIIEAQKYLYRFVPESVQKVYSGGIALERPRLFYKLLGDPQDSYKVIHIAGTAGKGSTCYYISQLLHGLGLEVGLSISPHLTDIRERFQVNNQLISEKDFCKYISDIIPVIEQMENTSFGYPSYFEIIQALAFYTFREKKVQYAVMETGLGGRFDPTNTVTRQDKVAVITKIGFDHTDILGKTLSKIAWEKAKIIQKHNVAFSIDQKPQVKRIITMVANEEKTNIQFVTKQNYSRIRLSKKGIQFDFQWKNIFIKNVQVSSFGLFQAENVSLALSTLLFISQRDGFRADEQKIRATLKSSYIPGRMEMLYFKRKQFLLDGAHSQPKMAALIKSLKKLYPGRKFTFIVAFKKNKDVRSILKYIVPFAKTIIITRFITDKERLQRIMTKKEAAQMQGYRFAAMNMDIVAQLLSKMNFTHVFIQENSREAVGVALTHNTQPIIITGSLFLVSEAYDMLHKTD